MRSLLLALLSIFLQSLARAAPGSQPQPEGSATPQEVVVKAADIGTRVKERKPPLNIQVDPYDSIRHHMEPPIWVLLPDLPFAVDWPHSHPEFLASPRVIEAWRSDLPKDQGIEFRVLERLGDALGRKMEPNEAKYCQWALSIVDENGEIFQYYADADGVAPPKAFSWNGRNDRGDWIQVGHSYSPVYKFVGPDGSKYTSEDQIIRPTGFKREEADGYHISLDLAVLFGPRKNLRDFDQRGAGLMRATADYIKLHDEMMVFAVDVISTSADLAKAQAAAISDYLKSELMLGPKDFTVTSSAGNPTKQQVDIMLKKRPSMTPDEKLRLEKLKKDLLPPKGK